MRKQILLFIVICISLFTAVTAQDTPMDAYFLAPDPDGVIQVWHWGENLVQITVATTSIVDFTVAHDRLSVVYTSEGKLWLVPLHDAEPYVIAEIDPETSPSAFPLFSPDDLQLVYGNNGIWVYAVDGTEPRLVIESIPFGENTTEVGTLRYYFPNQFIPDTDWLILTIGLWEGWTTGLLNIATGEIVEIDPIISHYHLLPLADGRLVVYGNNARFGDANVEITTPDALNTRSVLIDLTTIIPDTQLFVSQIIEIEPGVLRVMGYPFAGEDPASDVLVFDFDLNTNALVGEVQTIALPASTSPQGQTSVGVLSPDGNLLSIYINATLSTELDGRGIVTGELVIYDLATDSWSLLPGLETVSSLIWK